MHNNGINTDARRRGLCRRYTFSIMKILFFVISGLVFLAILYFGWFFIQVYNASVSRETIFKAEWKNIQNINSIKDKISIFEYGTNRKILELGIEGDLRDYLNQKRDDYITVKIAIGGKWWTSRMLVPTIDDKMYSYTEFNIIDDQFLNTIKK